MTTMGIVENRENLALQLGCSTGTLPTTYLGLPLGMWRNLFELCLGQS